MILFRQVSIFYALFHILSWFRRGGGIWHKYSAKLILERSRYLSQLESIPGCSILDAVLFCVLF